MYDHIQWPQNAPLTLIEYGDYECPYCWEAYYIIKNLQRKLKNQFQFIFRNFPLIDLHQNALNAAIAAEAATTEGKFREMHDIIFENQEHLNEDDLLSYAKIIGLNEQIFIKDFQSKTPLDKINADIKYGEKAGVDSTPTFFINGTLYTGNREDEELFLADIQQMLSYLKQ